MIRWRNITSQISKFYRTLVQLLHEVHSVTEGLGQSSNPRRSMLGWLHQPPAGGATKMNGIAFSSRMLLLIPINLFESPDTKEHKKSTQAAYLIDIYQPLKFPWEI